MTANELCRLIEHSLVLWGVDVAIDVIDTSPPRVCVAESVWIESRDIDVENPTAALWEFRTAQRTDSLRSIAIVLRRLREHLDPQFQPARALIGVRAVSDEAR